MMPKSVQKNTAKKIPNECGFTYEEWLLDLAEIPLLEQKQWIKDTLRPKHMLHIFGKYFFPHLIEGDFEVEEPHLDLIAEMSTPENSAIIFPRGFAKTTWERIDTIHDVVYGLEPVILYIGNTKEDAGLHFEAIKTEFENNESLMRVFGWLVPSPKKLGRKWTNRHLETTNGVNVVARGAGKGRGVNIKGKRPTKIIMDDIEDDEGVASPLQRNKLNRWIYNVIFNSKDKSRGKIKMIGTVLSPLCEVLKFYKNFGGIFRKAIEDGKSICPVYFPLDKLLKIRDGYVTSDGIFVAGIGTRAFSQEYLNTPVNDDVAIIKREWLDKSIYSGALDPLMLRTVIMLDPQAGEKQGSDFYGLCVLGFYPKDRHRYIIEIKSGKASQLEQAAELIRTWLRYPNALVVGVEKILTQVAVYQNILEWKSGLQIFDKNKFPDLQDCNRNMPFRAVEPRGKDGGVLKDKKARLQMHEAAIERGELHIHAGMENFIEKLTSFPDVEHDDDIDALIYCLDFSYNNGLSTDTPKDNNKNRKSNALVGDIMNEKF